MKRVYKNKKINKKLIIFICICLLLIIGCVSIGIIFGKGNKKDNSVKDSSNNDAVEEKKISIVDMDSDSRPYAVIYNNFISATKVQSGLNKAYIVYEFPIEGGISRSLALFKDFDDVKVGTIRSARQNYLDYVLENDAILVHFGGNYKANEDMPTLGIDDIDGNSDSPFYRENPMNLAREHTAYGNLKDIKEYSENTKKYRSTTSTSVPLNYTTDIVDLSKYNDSLVSNSVTITYSNSFKVNFSYDSTSMRYNRYINSEEHKDYFTNEIYSTKNIIILNVDTDYLSGHTDTAGSEYLNIENIGTGTGYYITNGYAIPISWEKSSRSSKTIYKYNNKEISINDGNTYIMFQPSNYSSSIE